MWVGLQTAHGVGHRGVGGIAKMQVCGGGSVGRIVTISLRGMAGILCFEYDFWLQYNHVDYMHLMESCFFVNIYLVFD